jgi:hypothetical protein
MSEKPGKRLAIHSNAARHKTPSLPPRLVSRVEYALRKTLAIFLSFGLSACGLGCVLLLLFLAYGLYSDMQQEWLRMWSIGPDSDFDLSGRGVALAKEFCVTYLPFLLLTAIPLWLESRDSWKTVRALQPINFADTTAIPEEETLVRASDIPPSHQQAELLRAAPQGSETLAEELLRATTNRQGE